MKLDKGFIWKVLIVGIICSIIALLVNNAVVSNGIVNRAKKDVNPLVGGLSVVSTNILGPDKNNPYILRFVIEFSKPVKNVIAYYSFPGSTESMKKGIKFYALDEMKSVYLLTFDTAKMHDLPQGFKTPVSLYIGCYNSISKYPNFERLDVRPNTNIPKSEYGEYLESTPLEVVTNNWDKRKERYEWNTVSPIPRSK